MWQAPKVDDKAGCGGLIRDSFGMWISGYSKNLGVCNSLVVGLRGVLEWLMIARMLGMKVGEVSEDSIQVANDINNRKILNPMGRTLMNRIRDLVDLEWKVIIRHLYREENSCADALAKRGFDLSFLPFYSCPP